VNENYAVRFGMGAVKGVGAGAVQTIVENRKEGNYKSIFDLAKRIDLRAANKKAFENLALAGGFDGFTETHRAQYFHHDGDGITFLEKAIRYGSKFQENENSAQVSLFGDTSEVQIAEPSVPPCDDWSTMEKLAKEKEVVGIYISGHPLDDYKYEMKYFCNAKLESLKNLAQHLGKNLSFGGIVTNVQHRTAKNGKGWATFALEGYDESYEFRIFDEDYLKYRHFLLQNQFVYFKINVKEGWVNRETGKKSDPRIQFVDAKMLADVLNVFAKKLMIHLDIKELNVPFVTELNNLFMVNKGDHTVTFEVMELERIKKIIEMSPVIIDEEMESIEEGEEEAALDLAIPVEKEDIVVKTKLSMPSRKLKVKISSELLHELDKMQVSFKLN
jgi:DNA polymerase-3 subunit alpha